MKKSTKIVLITAAALIVLGIIISSISLKDGANIEVRREDGSTNSVGEMINEAIDKAGSYVMEQIDAANVTGSGDYVGERSWNEVSADNTYSVAADGVSSLDLAWIGGIVEIVPVSGDEIKISETCENPLDDETALCWRVENGTLEIKYSARRDELPVKYLRIGLPETIELEDVAVDMTTSSISAEGHDNGEVERQLRIRQCHLPQLYHRDGHRRDGQRRGSDRNAQYGREAEDKYRERQCVAACPGGDAAVGAVQLRLRATWFTASTAPCRRTPRFRSIP